MKNQIQKLVAVVCLLASFSLATRAQTPVDVTNFGVMRGDIDTNSRAYLGFNQSTTVRALGNPASRSSEYSDLYDQAVDVWVYNGNKLYFVNDKLTHVVIVNNALAVGTSYSTAFRVGDKATVKIERVPFPRHPNEFITTITKSFYTYSLDKTPGTSTGIPYSMSSLSYLKDGTGNLDEVIEVLFDNGDRIINIDLGS